MTKAASGMDANVLREAFKLAEERLRGEENDLVAETIAQEAGKIQYESILDGVIARALSERFPAYRVKKQHNRIDVAVIGEGKVLAAIQCKGMVANSHKGVEERSAVDVHGIKTKLDPSKRSQNCVATDIKEITGKILAAERCAHFQIFVPVVYELYRTGGEHEWFAERKPWTTQPRFRDLRKGLRRELEAWFKQAAHGGCKLLYAVQEPVRLKCANEFWLQYSKATYSEYEALDAYVSFFAFYREAGTKSSSGLEVLS